MGRVSVLSRSAAAAAASAGGQVGLFSVVFLLVVGVEGRVGVVGFAAAALEGAFWGLCRGGRRGVGGCGVEEIVRGAGGV